MHKTSKGRMRFLGIVTLLVLAGIFCLTSLPSQKADAQQPTGSIPTVTGTPPGPYVTVYTSYTSQDQIVGVYAGPDSEFYAQIGILTSGETVPALGISEDNEWIQILYPGVPGGKGWVWGRHVELRGGELSIVQSPPTATPRTTPTIDPTYAAAYGLNLVPSPQPTFTAPAALNIPTFTENTSASSKVPYGLIIVGLILVGVLGAIVSFVRGSR